jgi:hypothetical protein
VLTLASAPNFDAPTDSNTNNSYVVEVTANDGHSGTVVQTITVTVTDVDETPAPDPTPTPDPTPVITIVNPNGGTTVVSTSPGGNTTIPTPAPGSTVTTSGSGTTTVTNPGSTVTLNNTGTGTVTTTGITGITTLDVTGTGPQKADLSGMHPGDVLTINNTGTGTVDLSNLPDGVKDSDGATPSIENKAPALTGGVVGAAMATARPILCNPTSPRSRSSRPTPRKATRPPPHPYLSA